MNASSDSRSEVVETVPSKHRAKVQVGFMLCCAGLCIALAGMIVLYAAPLFLAARGDDWLRLHQGAMELASSILATVVECVLIAGWIALYLVSHGSRWRQTNMWLLGLAGADLVMLATSMVSTDSRLNAIVDLIGMALGLIELWLLAVLAAEAAESAGRSDVTHQTEVVGRLILATGAVWAGAWIWTFDPASWPTPVTADRQNGGDFILGVAAIVLYLFVLFRTVSFCGSLAAEYAKETDQKRPERTV